MAAPPDLTRTCLPAHPQPVATHTFKDERQVDGQALAPLPPCPWASTAAVHQLLDSKDESQDGALGARVVVVGAKMKA